MADEAYRSAYSVNPDDSCSEFRHSSEYRCGSPGQVEDAGMVFLCVPGGRVCYIPVTS